MVALVKGLSGSATVPESCEIVGDAVSYKRGRASVSGARSASQLEASELRRAR